MGTASRHQRHLAERGWWPRCHKANAQGQQRPGDPAGGPGTAECDGSGAGKIQRPGNTPRMEAFSLPATSPPEEAAELASVIPGWRVNRAEMRGSGEEEVTGAGRELCSDIFRTSVRPLQAMWIGC